MFLRISRVTHRTPSTKRKSPERFHLSRNLPNAQISERAFRGQYVAHEESTKWEAVGLLFVYNHDGAYDASFGGVIDQVDERSFTLPADRRMFVFGPKQISYLYTVSRWRLSIGEIASHSEEHDGNRDELGSVLLKFREKTCAADTQE